MSPRTQIVVTDIDRDGISPVGFLVADATNKHYFTGNDGQVYLEIQNVAGSANVVVEASPNVNVDGLEVADLNIIAMPGTTLAGPFRRNTFNQNTNADVYVNPDTSGTLRLRAYRLTRTA